MNSLNRDRENKCNENWHVFPDENKPCQCGKIKNFTEYVLSMAKKKK